MRTESVEVFNVIATVAINAALLAVVLKPWTVTLLKV